MTRIYRHHSGRTLRYQLGNRGTALLLVTVQRVWISFGLYFDSVGFAKANEVLDAALEVAGAIYRNHLVDYLRVALRTWLLGMLRRIAVLDLWQAADAIVMRQLTLLTSPI